MADVIYWYKDTIYTSSKSYQARQRASMTRRDDSEHTRRMELASFLRTRRERLLPEHVGLPLRPRRRTPGLRREEVAELIGIGVTWYTWLEQARAIHVSVDVVEQLARVFRLSEDERAYLFQLAQQSLPPTRAEPHEAVRPVFRDVLTAVEPSPAHIRDRSWNVLAWNRAESFLVDWHAYPASATLSGITSPIPGFAVSW